jgi:hypothetical protein
MFVTLIVTSLRDVCLDVARIYTSASLPAMSVYTSWFGCWPGWRYNQAAASVGHRTRYALHLVTHVTKQSQLALYTICLTCHNLFRTNYALHLASHVTRSIEYGIRKWPQFPLRCDSFPHKLIIASPTSGGGSVGIVRSRTQTMEFSLCV